MMLWVLTAKNITVGQCFRLKPTFSDSLQALNFLILLPSTQFVFDMICQNDLKFDPHMKPTITIDQVHQQKREMKIVEVFVNFSV